MLLSLVIACKTKKNVSETIGVKETKEAKLSLSNIIAKQANFKTFATKAKTTLNIDDKSNDVTLNIRIKKDEVIWVSITYFAGLEIARALITPDSIKIINRVQNQYSRKPFSFIHDYANKQIDFKTLQAIIIGNSIPFATTPQANITKENNETVLAGISEGLAYRSVFNTNYKVVKTSLADNGAQQNLELAYNTFENFSGINVPSIVKINSKAKQNKIQIDMEYSKTEFNTMQEFPFSVSKKFAVVD